MQLKSATVLPIIKYWSDRLREVWTGADQQHIADQLVALSAYVTPHIVEDAAIQDDKVQAYLLAKMLQRLNDWLARTAAQYRRMYRIDNPDKPDALLDLRSATVSEIAQIHGIADVLAKAVVRYVAERPKLISMATLTEIKGIGEQRLADLEAESEIGFPMLGFMSASMWQFVLSPNVPTFLSVLEHSDVFVFFGTQYSISARVSEAGERIYDRFAAFLTMVTDQAARVSVAVGGALASEALAWLKRHQMRETLLSNMENATGGILINDAYVVTARQAIEAAQNSVTLMVFLGTLAENQGDRPGPAQLVEALEVAQARGVDVRVIVDRDERTDPYKSFLINSPLVKRLTSNGVDVKFDEPGSLLHSKVLVVDKDKVIVGSHNWTRASFNTIHELSIYLKNESVATQYFDRFQIIWDKLPEIAQRDEVSNFPVQLPPNSALSGFT